MIRLHKIDHLCIITFFPNESIYYLFHMIFKIVLTLLFLTSSLTFAQSQDRWTAFKNPQSQTRLIGFKNSNGDITIEPKFGLLTIAKSFDNIIGVMERNKDNEFDSYYLTKSGKKIGMDSLYIFAFAADCEQDGLIRFEDHKTEKTGMFDIHGNIAIPAEYDLLSRANNGMISALKGAHKHKKNQDQSSCNHSPLEGGIEYLISTDNRILVENFKNDWLIDYYSLRLSKQPNTQPTEVAYKGENGMYYIFTDFRKGFESWVKNDFLQNLTKSKLYDNSLDSVTFIRGNRESEPLKPFITRNNQLIIKKLSSILNSNSDYFIGTDELNAYYYRGNNYDEYFNTCGEPKQKKTPYITNHY